MPTHIASGTTRPVVVEHVDLPTVAALWGHSRLDTVRIYAQPDGATLERAAESLARVRALEASDEGRAFVVRLRVYLDQFGWRSDGIYEVADATWRKDATIPLNTIQGWCLVRAIPVQSRYRRRRSTR